MYSEMSRPTFLGIGAWRTWWYRPFLSQQQILAKRAIVVLLNSATLVVSIVVTASSLSQGWLLCLSSSHLSSQMIPFIQLHGGGHRIVVDGNRDIVVAPVSSSSTSFCLPFLCSLAANRRIRPKQGTQRHPWCIDGVRALGCCAKWGPMVWIRGHQCPWCSHVGNTMVVCGCRWKYLTLLYL
jgi:hypothetical protein